MAQINLETALQTINRAVTEHSSATDTQLEDYMMELINSNGEIIDKQPLSRLRDFVYNYLVTNKASDLADLVNSFNPIAFTEFPYLDSAAFFSRSTAGGKQIEGNTATIKAFKGNTLSWNQFITNGGFRDGSNNWEPYNTQYISISVSNGVITATNISEEEIRVDRSAIRQRAVSSHLNHKYYLRFYGKTSHSATSGFQVEWGQVYINRNNVGTDWYKYEVIFTQLRDASAYSLFIKVGTGGANLPPGGSYQVKNVVLFDLTAIFGSGNEPSNIREFEAMFPLDYYDYNAGSLLNNDMTHFVSSGTDASGFTFTDTLPIPITQLTGKLNGAGESATIFPDGLRSAGNAYDIIEKVDNQWYGVVNIGSVDMGSLTWTRSTSYANPLFYTQLSDKSVKLNDVICGSSLLAYVGGFSNAAGFSPSANKSIGYGYANNQIFVRDDTYTDAETFKTAISGAMLNYELATPQRYLLDTEFQSLLDTYRVANNGTEMILPVNTSTPTTTPAAFDLEYRVIDNEVKRICVENWGGNYVDGEITKYEASQVTNLGTVFQNNTNIVKFDEFKYFTGISSFKTSNNDSFFRGSSLESITFPDNATNLSYALTYCTNIKSVDLTNLKGNDLNLYAFIYNSGTTGDIREVKLKGTTYVNLTNAFFLTKLTRLIIDGTADFSKVTSFSNVFGYTGYFTTIIGTIVGIKFSISVSASPLTRASALVLINGLDTVSTTQTITFSATTYALLTSEDIAIATGKGWTVASAS